MKPILKSVFCSLLLLVLNLFQQAKAVETLPYHTEFNGSLEGWESVDLTGGLHWKWSNDPLFLGYMEVTTTTRENGYALYDLLQNEGPYVDPAQGALVSPVFDFSTIEDAIDLSFDYIAMAYWIATTLQVQVSTDNFQSQIVDAWSSSVSNWYSVSEVVTVDLSAFAGEAHVQIRFLYTGGVAFGWAIDDITIAVNNEPRLKTLTVSDGQLSPAFDPIITYYTLKVPYELSSISIQGSPVRPSDSVTGTGLHLLEEGNNVVEITVSNVDDSAQKIYIVTVNRSGPIISVPFAEDFETGAPAWRQVNGTQANQWHIGTATAASGQYSAYISMDGGVTNSYADYYSHSYLYCDVYFTPYANPETDIYELSFDWKGVGENGCDYLCIYLLDTDVELVAGKYISSYSYSYAYAYAYAYAYGLYQQSNTWQNIAIPLSGYPFYLLPGDVKRLVFMWINDSSINGQPPIAIDNVSIRSVDINEAKLASLTVSAGKLSPDFSPEIYNYRVSVPNEVDSICLDASAIRPKDTVSGMGTKSLEEGDNSFQIIVSNADDSAQKVYTITVRRHKPALQVPFIEDFETGAPAWKQANAPVNQWHIGTATAASGQYSAYISSDGGLSNSWSKDNNTSHLYCDVYFTPHTKPETYPIYELSFDWKGFATHGSYNLTVMLIDPDVEPIAGQYSYMNIFSLPWYQQSRDWQKAVINLSNGAYSLQEGDMKRLLFRWYSDGNEVQLPTAIDNIILRSVEPYEAKLANLTVSAGELSPFFSGDIFDYTVFVREEENSITLGASPMRSQDKVSGTGSKSLQEGDNLFEITVSNPEGTVHNTYKVLVKHLPLSFEIFSETFEDENLYWSFANEGQTNQWHIGTATAASGQHAAYISNDGGITNRASSPFPAPSSISYMSHLVQFIPPSVYTGYYQIGLDWKGWGTAQIMLVEEDNEPVAGQYGGQNPYGYMYFNFLLPSGASTWNKYVESFDLWSHPGATRRLQLLWHSDNSVTQPPLAIDNLSIYYVYPHDAALRSITLNHGELSPAFDPRQFEYTVDVNSNVDKIKLDAVPNNLNATVIGANQEFNLNTGSNTFHILVLSEDKDYQKTYSVRVYRQTTALDFPTAETLKVYPNPTQGMVYIENAGGREIKLYNSFGELLEQTRENSIDLSVYPKGVYLLKIGGTTVKIVNLKN